MRDSLHARQQVPIRDLDARNVKLPLMQPRKPAMTATNARSALLASTWAQEDVLMALTRMFIFLTA
jgi:hypothetical protein